MIQMDDASQAAVVLIGFLVAIQSVSANGV
jgi:hypothetical protein